MSAALKLIGLAGKKQSGKTTVANYLMSAHHFIQVPFSQPIKWALADLLVARNAPDNLIDAYVDGALKELPTEYLGGKSPREFMQRYGDLGRELTKGFWVDIAMRASSEMKANIVIPDVRFPDEVAAIRRHGGTVFYIDRQMIRTDDHNSENSLKPEHCDHVVLNAFTSADFFAKEAAEFILSVVEGVDESEG